MVSQSTGDGNVPDHHHLRARHRSRPGAGAGPEPGRRSPSRSCPTRCARRGITTKKNSPDLMMVIHLNLAGRVARPALHLQLRDAADQGRAGPAAGRRRHPGVRRARLLDAHLARPGAAGRAGPDRRPTWSTPSAAQNVQVASGSLEPAAGAEPGRLPAQRRDAGPAARTRAVREHHRQDRRRRPRSRASATSPGSSWAPRTTCATPISTTRTADRARHLPAARLERAGHRRRRQAHDGGAQEAASPRASTTRSSTTRPSSSSSRSTR